MMRISCTFLGGKTGNGGKNSLPRGGGWLPKIDLRGDTKTGIPKTKELRTEVVYLGLVIRIADPPHIAS